MQNYSLKMQPQCIVHKNASAVEFTNNHAVTILIDALIAIVNRLYTKNHIFKVHVALSEL